MVGWILNQVRFRQTKPTKVKFANFRGRSPEPSPKPLLLANAVQFPLKQEVPELIPDSFPKGSRTSLSSVWFAATTSDLVSLLSAIGSSRSRWERTRSCRHWGLKPGVQSGYSETLQGLLVLISLGSRDLVLTQQDKESLTAWTERR